MAGSLRAQNTTNQPPLPKIDEVLKQIAARSTQEDDEHAFKLAYSYHRMKVKEVRNGSGELKKREVKTGEHVPKPETDDADPDDDIEQTEPEGHSITNLVRSGRGKAFDRSDFALTDELLNRFKFTLVGREKLQDRPVLVIDFHPRGGNLPENGIKDKFINKAAGRVWVDEEDYALVKADLYLTKRVNVFGGLIGAVWEFTFQCLRERTEEGYWFVRNSGWHLEGRQVFLTRIIDYTEEKTDVKRYTPTEQAKVTTR